MTGKELPVSLLLRCYYENENEGTTDTDRTG